MGIIGEFMVRRPFSRRIRLNGDGLIRGDHPFIDSLRTSRRLRPLEAVLTLLDAAYRGDAALAARATAEARRQPIKVTRLFETTDLHRLFLATFKAALRSTPRLSDETAMILDEFAAEFDPCKVMIEPASERPQAPQPLLRFDRARIREGFRIVLVFRRRYAGPGSRLHDIGPRFITAFESVGMHCVLIDPAEDDFELPLADLVLVDGSYIERTVCRRDRSRYREMLQAFRKKAPRLGMIEFDPWTPEAFTALADADDFDFVWTAGPQLAVDGRIGGRPACLAPYPVGFPRIFDALPPPRPCPHGLAGVRFCGAVEEYNLSRYHWLLAGHRLPRPFEYVVTGHSDDETSVERSMADYLHRLSARRGCLNFNRRRTGASILVGRTSDVLRAGRLLIEERSETLDRYLAPGVHYLPFANLGELADAIATAETPEADRIAREGELLFKEAYSDQALSEHLMTFV